MATSKQKMENRKGGMKTPPVVSPQEWQVARQQLLVKEKALTRSRDALAAERRRMPWMAVEKKYEFDGPKGKVSLLDLFEGHHQRQLRCGPRRRPVARPQCIHPRRRAGVPHILHQRPRRRGDGNHLELPRYDGARPSGDLGGLARELPPDPDVQVVELARQLRGRGLA